MKKRSMMTILVLLLATAVGCGRSGLPGLVPGKGIVLYDDQPLEEATVTFHTSETNPNARGAIGTTNSAGQFTLMTLNPNDGIAPGDYIVTVSKIERPPPAVGDDAATNALTGGGGGVAVAMRPKPPKHLISPKYYSRGTTDIKVTIGPKGDKDIKLELRSK